MIEEVVRLRNRVEELEAENKWLWEALDPKDSRFRSIGVTPKERTILCRIYDSAPNPVCNESLITAARLGENDYAENSLKVFIWKIRKKLGPIGVEIKCIYGVGYIIDNYSRAILSRILERENAQ